MSRLTSLAVAIALATAASAAVAASPPDSVTVHLDCNEAVDPATMLPAVQCSLANAINSARRYADAGDAAALAQARGYTDQRFQVASKRIDSVSAMASAQSNVVAGFAGADPANRNRVAFGVGTARGRAAVAVGYQRVAGPAAFNVTASAQGGEFSVGAGVGIGW